MLRAFLKDLIRYIPSQVLPGFIAFLSVPVITRLVPPGDYGNYTLVMATVMIFTTICGWVGMGVIRFYVPYKEAGKERDFRASVTYLCLFTVAAAGIAFCLALMMFAQRLEPSLWLLMRIGIVIFIARAVSDVLCQFLRVQYRLGWFNAYKIWEAGGTLLLGLVLVLGLGAGVKGLLWGAAIASLLALVPLWRQVLGDVRLAANRSALWRLAREIAAYSLPLVAGNLAAWVLSLGDRYVLAVFRSSYEVGIYAAAYSIAEKSILVISTLFMFASGPLLVEICETRGAAASGILLTSVMRAYLILCIPAVVGLAALSKQVMGLLTGAEYAAGYRVLPWVTAGAFFLGFQQRYQAGLVLKKKTVPIMASLLMAGLLNILLNIIFVPRYGYVAAAITTLVCYALLAGFMVVVSQREFAWHFPWGTLTRSALASAVMAAAVYPIGQGLTRSSLVNLGAGITVGISVYVLVLFASGELHPAERQKIAQSFHKRVGLVLGGRNE